MTIWVLKIQKNCHDAKVLEKRINNKILLFLNIEFKWLENTWNDYKIWFIQNIVDEVQYRQIHHLDYN